MQGGPQFRVSASQLEADELGRLHRADPDVTPHIVQVHNNSCNHCNQGCVFDNFEHGSR
jgi:hypothetical protein